MGRLIPAGTGMEYYRNVDIERDETIGDAQREELEEFPGILAADLPVAEAPVHAAITSVAEAEVADEAEVAEVEEE